MTYKIHRKSLSIFIHLNFDIGNLLILRFFGDSIRFWHLNVAFLGVSFEFEYLDWAYSPF